MDYNLLFLVFIGFIAGIINTIAGGGSLLTLPMLIFMGLPPSIANGTNRIAILIQNFFSSAGFKSKGITTFPFSIWMGISALLGSIIGAYLGAIYFKDEIFNKILAIVMVIIVVYMIFKPKVKRDINSERIEKKYFWHLILTFFFIGIYGGFIQAGTGIFILLALNSIGKISLVKSNAIKTVVVIFYTLSALAIYAYNDKINYSMGLTLAIGNSAGAWFSSRYSVNKGDDLVRWFLIIMVSIMAVKLFFS
ncbi:MAG TPA: sulfite exporter TauE/SafE family protein [Flavobacteriaceae bacterium]|nr:sulfite exporter TauE/SafE family protein [Flavobacteriaceae bacterium]